MRKNEFLDVVTAKITIEETPEGENIVSSNVIYRDTIRVIATTLESLMKKQGLNSLQDAISIEPANCMSESDFWN